MNMNRDLLARRRAINHEVDLITRRIGAICRKCHSSTEQQQALNELKSKKENLTQELCMINRNMRQIKAAKVEYHYNKDPMYILK